MLINTLISSALMRSDMWGVKGLFLPGKLGTLPRPGVLASSFFPQPDFKGLLPLPLQRGGRSPSTPACQWRGWGAGRTEVETVHQGTKFHQ